MAPVIAALEDEPEILELLRAGLEKAASFVRNIRGVGYKLEE